MCCWFPECVCIGVVKIVTLRKYNIIKDTSVRKKSDFRLLEKLKGTIGLVTKGHRFDNRSMAVCQSLVESEYFFGRINRGNSPNFVSFHAGRYVVGVIVTQNQIPLKIENFWCGYRAVVAITIESPTAQSTGLKKWMLVAPALTAEDIRPQDTNFFPCKSIFPPLKTAIDLSPPCWSVWLTAGLVPLSVMVSEPLKGTVSLPHSKNPYNHILLAEMLKVETALHTS
jgi:hypothetical protein